MARPISHAWNLVIWFFWGSVLSLIAYDWSDYMNYRVQASGVPLNAVQQPFYFTILPTLLYVGAGYAAYLFAERHLLSPWHFFEAFLILVVIIPGVAAALLPQAHNPIFDVTVAGGVIVSLFIGYRFRRTLAHYH